MGTVKKKKSIKYSEDSSSGVSSLSGLSSNYDIRKIIVYKNGDRFHRGVKFVINPRIIRNMEPLLNQINDRIELSHGAKRLYTKDGKLVKEIKQLEDGKIYIAASNVFIPMKYGEYAERVWKPPSRKHSPILSEDRIRTARTRSQEPRSRSKAKTVTGEKSSIAILARSKSVKSLAENRKSRIDLNANGTKRPPAASKKMIDNSKQIQEGLPPKSMAKPKTPVTQKAVVKKTSIKGARKPINTAVSVASTIPKPTSLGDAEMIEFPEEKTVYDVETIHKTPSPPQSAVVKTVSEEEHGNNTKVEVIIVKEDSAEPDESVTSDTKDGVSETTEASSSSFEDSSDEETTDDSEEDEGEEEEENDDDDDEDNEEQNETKPTQP